jgi:hypothetical protein
VKGPIGTVGSEGKGGKRVFLAQTISLADRQVSRLANDDSLIQGNALRYDIYISVCVCVYVIHWGGY